MGVKIEEKGVKMCFVYVFVWGEREREREREKRLNDSMGVALMTNDPPKFRFPKS